ncbi:hypothetical protein EMPS_00290 [Entomortierella parvispora]|uniref:F-box domain-containing protein n=1 Tax=Entomortierella parvispora TaxID=205924 RepID=A0A9P3LRJ9_9FUNG|nr:hypothetical protein EMPS_00290 [Entomortierella parvispora]
MPKSRIREFCEDDLLDYLNDWDFNSNSDHGVHTHQRRKGKDMISAATSLSSLGRRKQRKWRAQGYWASSRQFHLPPEVLERICYFSSQASLRLRISLVCKQWRLACLRYLWTGGVWEATNDSTVLIDKLRSNCLTTLSIDVLTDFSPASTLSPKSEAVRQHTMAWRAFYEAIVTQSFPATDESIVPAIYGLKELRYNAVKQLNDDPILSLLPHLGFLRRLSLEYQSNMVFPLFDILNQCANLKALAFKSRTNINRVVSSGSLHLQHRHLEELSISNVIIDQSALERILDTCPNLTEFKAQHLNEEHYDVSGRISLTLDFDSLYRRAADKCPRLQWIHFMMASRAQGVAPLHLVPLHLPWIRRMSLTNAHHRGLLSDPWTPDREERVLFSSLTHIEICSLAHEKMDPRSLDKILRCAPSLIHLSAGNVCFQLTEVRENWDPIDDWHRWPVRMAQKTKKERRKEHRVRSKQLKLIAKGTLADYMMAQDWQCSHLRTLDISVWTSNYHPTGEDQEFYRYLAQRCPAIVHLTLRSSKLQAGQQMPERLDSWPYYRTNPQDISALKKNKVWAPNSIPVLGGLKHLESLTLIVGGIDGLILPQDFEYLKRSEGSVSIGGDQGLLTSGNQGHTVIWPRLESFTVEYSSWIVTKAYDELVLELEKMRPGVAFRIGPRRK